MVQSGAHDRIQALLHHVCHRPYGAKEVHNKLQMKDLVRGANQSRLASMFAYGIWPSHGWDEFLPKQGGRLPHVPILACKCRQPGHRSTFASDCPTQPRAELAASTVHRNGAPERPGDHIGHYKLLQQIGEGGCGVVFMAEQEEPIGRRVALKTMA